MTFSADLGLACPELILAVGAMVLLVVGRLRAARPPRWSARAGAAWCWPPRPLWRATGPLGPRLRRRPDRRRRLGLRQGGDLRWPAPSAIPLGQRWFERRGVRKFEFPVLILLAALGMGMMASAGDLISLYVGVELQSLALYVLAAMHRDDAKASEAGLKYFVLGALSSGLLLYGASPDLRLRRLDPCSPTSPRRSHGGADTGVLFGLVFLICGLAFKVSAAPFHMWTPDVYEGAPTPVVAFFAAAPKLAAMVLFARVLAEGFAGAVDQWQQVLVAHRA